MNPTRRDILKRGAGMACLGALGMGGRAQEPAPAAKKIPVGLQLYSVRAECAKDLPGTLKAVAGIGYKGVEFAGYYKRTAAELKKMLDDNGLVCCGTHTDWKSILDDKLKETIEFNQAIGNRYLIVPGGLPGPTFASLEGCRSTAKILAAQTAKAKESGMRVGYHAHAGDFKKIGGTAAWDILFENAGKDFVMQLDTANCIDGGADPYATLRKFPGQSVTIHLKEHGGAPDAVIGAGTLKWKEIFEICETTGGTEWYIVEHESGRIPLESVKGCFEGLKKLGRA